MQNNKLSVLLVILAATSCTKKTPQTLLSKWDKSFTDYNVMERKLASSQNGQCLNDLFRTDTLKAEVEEYEKPFASAKRVNGTWKHLNLAQLPVPQANFLKTYGKELGDLRNTESIDYSSCEDVPCIFNKIYGRDNNVAGYTHYIWYLKFGNMLSADNMVPEQDSRTAGEYNGKMMPLSSYLYNDKELYALWRLTHMLKSPHTTLKYLKEIQRVPRGEDFEGADYKNACGLAFSGGWIKLTDGCLTVNDWNKDTGYLYQAVTHELTHHVDFEQGRGSKDFYRSYKPDYLDVSGFFLKEFVDEKGVTQRKWETKQGTKLVTSYAGTAPQENFAENIAVFRVDGDTAKSRTADNHFKFVSDNYYESKSFEKEQLLKTWIEEQSPDTGKSVFKAVIDCSKDAATPKSAYFKKSDFSSVIFPGMLNCLSYKGQEISTHVKTRSALYQPEGCLAINDKNMTGKWDVHMKEHLKGSFARYLVELEKDPAYLSKIQNFYSKLSDPTIAKDSFINCYKEFDEENCYNRELVKNTIDHALQLNLPEPQTKEMAELYISYHPYKNTKDETLKSYQIFISSQLETIRKEAQIVWDSCRDIPQNDEQSPTGSLFQIGSGYMVSSFYNCLNANIPDAVKNSVRSLSVGDMKIEHAKEEVLLTDEVRPYLVRILKDTYDKEKQKEMKDAAELIAQDKANLRSQIMSNFDWVKNVVDSNQIMADCKKEAARLIPFTPLYHMKQELFSDYLEKNICTNISSSSEFTKWMDESQDIFADKITNGLDDKLLELANLKADECLKEYPADTAINRLRFKRQREACLLNEWPKIESQVITNAMRDPMVAKFKMSVEDLKRKIENNRRTVQLRVIKSKFN